jgi:hypothetical protein
MVLPVAGARRAVRTAAAAALPLGLTLALAGCITPARTDEQYRAKAEAAVEAASSEVATVRLTVTQRQRLKLTGPYADEVVTAGETALDAIGGAFGAVQPPSPQSDPTHDDVSDGLAAAGDAVTHARIAVRRDDRAAYPGVLAELRSAAEGLSMLEERLG